MTQQANADHLAIAAAVIVSEEHVLLVRRRVNEGQLSWQFPAGKVEPGETEEDAAVRETREETGLEVKALKLLGSRVHPKTQRYMSYTACEVVSGTAHVAAPDELADLAWCSLSEIPQYVPYGLYGPVQHYLDQVMTR
ncbi:NUDIX hydrolase [Streptomyces sp. NPDC050528]|uniref:NUDIX hydrolase n=1 Tax=Streptomyces sp. NPDC050528 TaxID=3365623 RepID=UPI0037A2CE55